MTSVPPLPIVVPLATARRHVSKPHPHGHAARDTAAARVHTDDRPGAVHATAEDVVSRPSQRRTDRVPPETFWGAPRHVLPLVNAAEHVSTPPIRQARAGKTVAVDIFDAAADRVLIATASY